MLLQLAARNCRKVTDWVKKTETMNPKKTKRLELAVQQQEQWRARTLVSDVLLELVKGIEAKSVAGLIMEIIVGMSWEIIKLHAAWGWLKGHLALQRRLKGGYITFS